MSKPEVSEFVREKLRTSEFKDLLIEKKFIASLLKYKEVVRSAQKDFLPEHLSSDKHKHIYEQVMQFYDIHNTFMNTEAFQLSLTNLPEIKRRPYMKTWNLILKLKDQVKKSSALAFKSKLTKMYEARTIELGLAKVYEQLKKALTEGDSHIDLARKEFIDVVPKLQKNVEQVRIIDPFAIYTQFKARHIEIQKNPKLLNAVPTGIQGIDECITGLMPSEFGLVTAGTGVGKSIMMGDFSYECILNHGDLIYVSIEMSAEQLAERLYCRISKVKYEKFRKYSLLPEDFKQMDHKMDNLGKNITNRYRIIDLPSSATVLQVRNEIERCIEKEKLTPKLIIIDYMNILQGGFDWSKQLEIAVDLKQKIARYFKIGTWSANQLMGSKHEAEHVKISNMAFAKNIVDNVDIGIGIGQTEETDECDVFNIDFTKTRGFKGVSFTLQGDRSRMTFASARKESKTDEAAREEKESKLVKKEKLGGKVKV